MPELPEVETIKNVIELQIKKLQIESAVVSRHEVVAHPTAEKFCAAVAGQTVASMERRGKFIIICLASGDKVILHLRMTGCLLVVSRDIPLERHTHVILRFVGGSELRFLDTRRFGRFWLIRNNETDNYSGIHKLGIEPFSSDLCAEYLQKGFGKSKRAIKECLLDQSIIAGIGNIYSDEILFRAGISPSTPSNKLSYEDFEKLAKIIPNCLEYYIEKNKISPEDYLKTKGQEYRNTPFLNVYGHAGEPCPNCREKLMRTVICGRSSVYCPQCQK